MLKQVLNFIFPPKTMTLTEALQVGEVKIVAQKVSGEMSEKIATTQPEIIEFYNLSPLEAKNPELICFVDMGSASWKCFRRELIQEATFLKNPKIKLQW